MMMIHRHEKLRQRLLSVGRRYAVDPRRHDEPAPYRRLRDAYDRLERAMDRLEKWVER